MPSVSNSNLKRRGPLSKQNSEVGKLGNKKDTDFEHDVKVLLLKSLLAHSAMIR